MSFPNKATQFTSENQPSGRGRPVGVKNRSTVAKYWLALEQKIDNPITGENSLLSQEDIITLTMINKAKNGDVHAFKALMDNAYGSSTNIDLTTADKPVTSNTATIVSLVEYVKMLEAQNNAENQND